MHVFGYRRREKEVALLRAQGLILPEDVNAFAEGIKESMGRRLQWHTIAVTSLSLYFIFLYISIISVHIFYCRSCYCHLIRLLS